jgi:cell division septal protein FtsQ
MKRRKYLSLFLKVIVVVITLGLVVASSFFIFKGDFFKIKKVSCLIDEAACPGEIWTKLLSLSIGQNILFFPQRPLEDEIKASFPQIGEMVVAKILPETLAFSLELRKATAAFTQKVESSTESATPATDFFIADEEGMVFQKITSSLDLPRVFLTNLEGISVGQQIISKELTQTLALIVLLSKLDLKPEMIEVSEKGILVWLKDELEVSFSSQKEATAQVGSLQLILSRTKIEGKRLKRVDLRFDKPVIVEK